jgi:ketosteroid isomerase-like protein
MAEGWREVANAYVDWRMPVDEYRELDDERVLVLVGMAARGKTSGIDARELAPRPAHMLHICDRKVTRFVDYWDTARAPSPTSAWRRRRCRRRGHDACGVTRDA